MRLEKKQERRRPGVAFTFFAGASVSLCNFRGGPAAFRLRDEMRVQMEIAMAFRLWAAMGGCNGLANRWPTLHKLGVLQILL